LFFAITEITSEWNEAGILIFYFIFALLLADAWQTFFIAEFA